MCLNLKVNYPNLNNLNQGVILKTARVVKVDVGHGNHQSFNFIDIGVKMDEINLADFKLKELLKFLSDNSDKIENIKLESVGVLANVELTFRDEV